MTEKTSVRLGDVQKTLLLPLWGRAVEAMKVRPLLVDRTATGIIDKIDYDFSTLTKNISDITQLAWIARSLLIDRLVSSFLNKYPGASIVNIGCGLDTTFDRIDNGSIRWYDLDLADVIDLRRKFIPESERRKFIASSFLDADWFKRLEKEEHILFIAAGVYYYFEKSQIRKFFLKVADAFPGSEMVFDASSPRGVRVANKLVIENAGLDEKSFLKWGLSNASELETWDRRIKVTDEYFYFRELKDRISLRARVIGCISDRLKIQYLVHVKFSG
ncbi:MAG TPA: class I SAM-dependent methyltransferase [Candidatus Acidoferrales bacterium]|nr:class I SAM-dependent methyltransferase [Candidatus Acidoferrales bacterium]